ncbi:MAG TPA: DNA double-strand break repair nuclease NurA [Anaerolineaceae bacterium]|nr:DNA double-strand break repair nuclease NurA [Anaerolineaceae bacterium]
MPVNYAQIEHSQGQFAAQYAAWQAEQAARSGVLKGLLNDAAANPELLRQAIEEAEQQLTNLYLAKPTSEPILTHKSLPHTPQSYTLVAADGSQIVPSRHRALQFGVVNVGLIKAQIGSGEAPEIRVETELLALDHIQTAEGTLIGEDEVALLRDLAERKIIRQAVAPGDLEPIITLTDGPLDVFYRSTIQGDRGQEVQREVFEIDQDLRRRGVVTAGYIDKPGSAMLSRMLAIFQCKRQGLPLESNNRELNLSDRFILQEILRQPGERSAIFEAITRSARKPANSLPVAFFYLNVSNDENEPCLARLEFPLWVSEVPGLVDTLHAVIYKEAQVLDSHPYPYLLHRSHELAVVKRIEADEIEVMLQSQIDPEIRAHQQRSNKDYLKGLS